LVQHCIDVVPSSAAAARGGRFRANRFPYKHGPHFGALFAGVVAVAGHRRKRNKNAHDSVRTFAVGGKWPSDYVSAGSADEVLRKVQWPKNWPYAAEDFSRLDESDDSDFYSEPRLCAHVDDDFINALRLHYAEVFASYPDARILDICSSWISHYPESKTWSHVSITGMCEEELRRNTQADDYSVRDLIALLELPYASGSFDVVTCAVSLDYLTKPYEVMMEVARVLKPGGMVVLSTSNRCFAAKAVNIWLRTNDLEHVLIYGSYMHYTGQFEHPQAFDLGIDSLVSKSFISRPGFTLIPALAAVCSAAAVDAAGGRGAPALIAGILAATVATVSAPPPDPVYVIQARKIA